MKIAEMWPPEALAHTIEAALGLVRQTEDAALVVSDDPNGRPRRIIIATERGLAIADVEWESKTHGRLPAPTMELSFALWREVRTILAVNMPAVGDPKVSLTVNTPATGDIVTKSPQGRSARQPFDEMLSILLEKSAGVSRS